jgi:hypothetical protein
MRKTQPLYYLWHFALTAYLLGSASLKSSGQLSFKPNYYQYDASVLSTNTVYRLLEDPYGFIWMLTNKGILIFNGKTFESIRIPGNEQEIVNFCRYKNTVYASSYAGQLYAIDMLTLAIKEIALPEPTPSEATPFMLMDAIDNKLYLSKAHGIFLILDPEKENAPVLISRSDNLFKHLVRGDLAKIDSKNAVPWWKLWNNHIYFKSTIYELRNNQLKVFYTAGKKDKQLQIVSSYLQDGTDLYVGFLQSGGLVKYTNYNANSSQNTPQTILPKVEVGDILKDSKGNIWVSTLNNGVFTFLRDGKQVQKFSFKQQLQPDTWYIRNKNKNLDIGYNQLIVDQLKSGSFYKRWIGDTTINLNPVTLFSNHQNKTILFGSRSIYSQGFPDKELYSNILRFAYKDHYFYNGDMYICTPGSFIKFSPTLDYVWGKPQPRKFTTMFPVSDSLFAKGGANGLYLNSTPTQIKDRVTKVRVYNKDILACTDNGLFIKRGEQYFHINDKAGLPDNQCMQIEYYGDAYYKLLTKGGLAYIDQKTCKVTNVFNTQILGKDIIIHHFDVENDSVWLATNKGIYVLDESFLFTKEKKSVRAFLYPERLNNRESRYTQQAFRTKYTKAKQIKMLVELLDFSSNNYSISYQVENDEGIITERSQVVNNSFFVNTPEPGNYIVKVYIASNKNYIDKVLTYTLTITPLWYQTLWARLSLATSIIIVLWLTIRSITRYVIRGKEKRLKEKYATLQLQSQAFFTQLNPHFIFNALTPLQSHILKNEKIESLEYLDRFSSLMRDILKNSDKMETSLKKELKFIKEYIAIQQIRFSPSFIFELTVSETIDLENTSIPAMMLQPIIENAIEHGVKNMGAAGKISVEIGQERIRNRACIRIQISDNGSGITGNILKEAHALYILQKRVQTLQKKDNITASLTHGPGPDGTGTTFKLILPETSSLWSTGQ